MKKMRPITAFFGPPSSKTTNKQELQQSAASKDEERQQNMVTVSHSATNEVPEQKVSSDTHSEVHNRATENAASAERNSESIECESIVPLKLDLTDISIAFSKPDAETDWRINETAIIPDAVKERLLTNHAMPPKGFSFPYGEKKNQKVYLSETHLTGKNNAFKYSFEMKGVVCVPCALFAPTEVSNDRGKKTALGSFVLFPFRNYAKIHDKLKLHLSLSYHNRAQERADLFLSQMKSAHRNSLINQLDVTRKQQSLDNQRRLIPIVKTIILSGRMGIPLRGHRDDGVLNMKTALSGKEGNLRALLAFRVDSGDKDLKEHLENASKRATYISKTTQNEIIELCGNQILRKIVADIQRARFFSIIADETSDSSHAEQLCICVRYVHEDSTVKEEFVGYGSVADLTAVSISQEIVGRLKAIGLHLEDCVGQGYDGASSMAGHKGGVQALIRREFPMAIYVHCASHCLNLVLTGGSKVLSLQTMFTVLSDVINFINDSPKRRSMVDANLLALCDIRFIERHDAVLRFCNNFHVVNDAFSGMISNAQLDCKTRSRAQSLMTAMQNATFIVALASAKKVLSLTAPLSKLLQTINLDYLEAFRLVSEVKKEIRQWRGDDAEWTGGDYAVYEEAERLAEISGATLSKPRCPSRQVSRANYDSSTEQTTPNSYFKRSVWYPFLDAVISELDEKFTEDTMASFSIFRVLQHREVKASDCRDVYAMYGTHFSCTEEQLFYELRMYHSFCTSVSQSTQSNTNSILEQLRNLPTRFQNVKKCLQIAATIPVTTCEAERSFSAMKIIKNRLRSTMTDNRLNGLSLMYIHKEVEISAEVVIEEFAKLNKRKIDFVL